MWLSDMDDQIFSRKRKSVNANDWVEESFGVDKGTDRHKVQPSIKRHVGISFSSIRALYIFFSFVLIFLILLIRIAFLQLIDGSSYLVSAESNRRRALPIVSERGTIYDRSGNQLTENIPNFALALIPQDLPRDTLEREGIVRKLAELTTQTSEEIRNKLKKYGNYSYESIVIQEDLDYDTALLIQIEASDLPGIHIQRGSKRLYNNEEVKSISHLIGYEGKISPEDLSLLYEHGYLPSDSAGKTGVEKTYENILRGKYGKKLIEVDSRGREQFVISEEPPTPGSDIYLSIDIDAQKKLEEVMSANMKIANKSRASGIALDPRNGEIIAMVSLPTYDNNHFSGGVDTEQYKLYIDNEDKPLFNRAVGGMYPSGSTIKPIIAAIALQEKIITQFTTFMSTGGLRVTSWYFPDWKIGGHGLTKVRKSIAESVNTFYYYIGGGYDDFVGLGVDKITEYLRKIGFAKPLGIDITGEQAGFLPSKQWKEEKKGERWYVGDTYNLSIGQGDILVTPLQIANMTAQIANSGKYYKPHVVKEIADYESGRKIPVNYEGSGEGIIDSSHYHTVRMGMRDCVTYGSCIRLSSLPISVAGKTGTAQWHSEKLNHAWFTSFAPFRNPEIVVTIIVEEGEGGAKLAAPIANDFYKWWVNNR